jgi:hypothetical protein
MVRNRSKKKRDPIPEDFGSIQEAAEFWEGHDLTDYEDIFEDVSDVKINLVRRHFRVDSGLAFKIDKIANVRGVSSETLVNLWLQEKVSGE